MAIQRAESLFARMNDYEISLCLSVNRLSKIPVIKHFFRVISRLGDGIFWYTLMLMLPFIYGNGAMSATIHMMIVGLVTLIVYKVLKKKTVRTRPCMLHNGVNMAARPLDQYSFPSGHTMHAVSFSTVVLFYFPQLTLLVIPFTLLVMLSRVILGLHYPSDVLVGAVLGSLIAGLSFLFS